MLRGHFAYYGITGNHRRISWYRHQVVRIWRTWLSRRGASRPMNWDSHNGLLRRCPLPAAKMVHRYAAASKASA
jgi:hypothetical protein